MPGTGVFCGRQCKLIACRDGRRTKVLGPAADLSVLTQKEFQRGRDSEERISRMGTETSRQSERSRSAQADAIRTQYRGARVFLGVALGLLAGTALYLIGDEGHRIWSATRNNLVNLSIGLQTSATVLLEQSKFSAAGIAADIAPATEPSRDFKYEALREAMRFDPSSAYLGIVSASGETVLVDRTGAAASPQTEAIVRSELPRPSGTATEIWQLIRLPREQDWFLPLTIGVEREPGRMDVVFALVPARSLIAGSDSLQLLSSAWVSFIRSDGTRLISYSRSENTLQVNGDQIARETMQHVGGGPFEILRPSTGQNYLVSVSPSPSLPVDVGVAVPVYSLYAMWLQHAFGPALVLLIGLIAVIVFGVRLNRSLRRQRNYVTEQEYLAKHDSLTGLLNRDAFMRYLEHAIEAAPRDSFAVLLLDLNHFKDINDTLGHASGDHVLQEIGQRVETLMSGAEACVARLGGDELTVFARRMDDPEALEGLCARLQARLGETIVMGGVELNLSASIGAALYPQDAGTPAELLRCADIAMYAAKSEMRPFGRYSSLIDNFTPDMLALKSEFAKALREGGLAVVFQPKVRLSDGALIGLEALSRWTHPSMGPVPPAKFVTLAEGTELIHPFTQYVIRLVVEQIARWRRAGHQVPVAVNISANNLLDHTLVEKLAEVLRREHVPAHLLELEVTESAVMRYPETILKRLQAIRELGVRLSIDDFGTGYASLSYLKQLPVHTLKIDKSFILNLAVDAADQRIVRSSIQLAHSFGMTVVAEGVESLAAAQQLVAFGCDHAQGYYFGHPQSAADIESRWLERHELARLHTRSA